MIVKILDDPRDILYPLNDFIFDNPNIVYHGTCCGFSQIIETNGWQINNPPYDMDDVKYVCESLDSLGIHDNVYGTLRYFTLGMSNGEAKYPRFSKNYWLARNFASYKCGETISHLIEGIEGLLSSVELPQERRERLSTIKQNYDQIDLAL